MKRHELTCTNCPRGCTLEVIIEDGKIISLSGNRCEKGEEFAISEITAPKRSITSTVKTTSVHFPRAAVRTTEKIPVEQLFIVMEKINHYVLDHDCRCGEILIPHIYGEVDLIVTQTWQREKRGLS